MTEQNEIPEIVEETVEELPLISEQMNQFVKLYSLNGLNGTEAYKIAYNSHGSTRTCCVEASRLLKNPNITPWIEYYRKTKQAHITNEIKYSIDDAFKEFDDLKIIALESLDQYGRPNVSAANKAVEMKVRLKGLLSDEAQVNNSVTVSMGTVEYEGNPLELNVGDNPNDNTETEK